MRSWDDYTKTMERPETLWTAAKSDDLDSIWTLVSNGSDLNEKDHRGFSPLMLAAYAGSSHAVSLFLSLGADPDSCDPAGNSVLMGASFKGHVGIVEELIQAGARCDLRNASGMDAYDFAVAFGRKDVASLLERSGVQSRPVNRMKVLFGAFLSRLRPRRGPTSGDAAR